MRSISQNNWGASVKDNPEREESECPQHEHTESNMPEGEEGLAFVHK